MKTLVATVLTASLIIIGAGNGFAMEQETHNGNAYGTFNFGQKFQKHENMTVAEVKEKYAEHHGTLGAAPSKNFEKHGGCMMEK